MRDLDRRAAPLPQGAWVLLLPSGTSKTRAPCPIPIASSARARSWRDQDHQVIPQGAGGTAETHCCPGQRITVALMTAATPRPRWRVEAAALKSPPFRSPPMPHDGFLMRDLAPA